ncbi:hypothetical protein BTDUT50_13635 [Neobacillus thermocopriae]|nr:hypothetical protein BTDUT50_13635 [Neobacillus thermocopriae]
MNELLALPQLKDIRHLLPTRSERSYKKTTIQQKTHIIIHHSLTKTGSAFAFANYHVKKEEVKQPAPPQSPNNTSKQQNPIEQLINKLPNKILRYGDRGEDVRILQKALNTINFKCGEEDGVFGQKTRDAVKRVNVMFSGGNENGVYDEKTKNYIKSKLKEK